MTTKARPPGEPESVSFAGRKIPVVGEVFGDAVTFYDGEDPGQPPAPDLRTPDELRAEAKRLQSIAAQKRAAAQEHSSSMVRNGAHWDGYLNASIQVLALKSEVAALTAEAKALENRAFAILRGDDEDDGTD